MYTVYYTTFTRHFIHCTGCLRYHEKYFRHKEMDGDLSIYI